MGMQSEWETEGGPAAVMIANSRNCKSEFKNTGKSSMVI